MKDVTVERIDAVTAIVSVEVNISEDEIAEGSARWMALRQLWGMFRFEGCSIRALIDMIEVGKDVQELVDPK